MEEIKLEEELEKVVGAGDFSQEDLEKMAALLTMESKGYLIDLMNGKCPKCKKIIGTNVYEHYRNCKGY